MRAHDSEDAAQDADGVEGEIVGAGEAVEEEQAAGDEYWAPELVEHVAQAAVVTILTPATADHVALDSEQLRLNLIVVATA